jgi:hypothetical protein
MKLNGHLRFVSKAPTAAQSNFAIKLTGTLDIIDTLLLAQRQSNWKAFFPAGGADGSSGGTGTDTGTDTGGIGGGL